MKKYNYDRLRSCYRCRRTLDPYTPQISFILYGLITEQSIEIIYCRDTRYIEIVFYIVAIYVICKIRPTIA